jgi:serine/threonine protein kinase
VLRRFFQRLRDGQAIELPGYAALGVIRQGSMSVIFKGRDRKTGRMVAIKIHKPEARKAVERIESRHRDFTEGQITCAFDHGNIVKCFDHGELAGNDYLVLEYLEGVTLASLMAGKSRRLDGKQISYLHQAAAGLAHVHSKRFVHHDFCAKNLFVANEDRVKVIDFGLAVPLMNLPVIRSRVGTVEILAPELLRREPCDHRIDVFAWGVVAYQLLAGQWPFESPEHHQVLNQILNVHPVPLDRRSTDIPPEVANLVMRCLEKDPERRLGSMNTAVGVLERHLKPPV